jgi:drug/metabolite transporter (DMT)-like permease
VAGLLLLAVGRLRGRRLVPRPAELAVLATSGVLMWVGGNGGVNWAETRVDSGVVALVVGTMPIWVALMESVLDRRPPSAALIGSLLVGFAGLVVLSAPMLEAGALGTLAGVFAVVGSALSWGMGSILQRRRSVALSPVVSSAWQQLCGGVGFVVVALLLAEPTPRPTPEAWLAWTYLVVFGSLIAFTSFVSALELLPTPIVMTYTYVNPVIAVLLGWWLLDEPLTGATGLGMALILIGVFCALRFRQRAAAVATAPTPDPGRS